MTFLHEDTNRETTIGAIEAALPETARADQLGLLKSFTRHYYEYFPLEELQGRKLEDIAGATYGMWDFVYCYDQDFPKIRIFNPKLEEDGWMTPHTVIWILLRDMPFLSSSLRIELQRRGCTIHNIYSKLFEVERDEEGRCVALQSQSESSMQDKKEALIALEIGRISKQEEHLSLVQGVGSVLEEVIATVQDYVAMQQKVDAVIEELSEVNVDCGEGQISPAETVSFLKWLKKNHFTFLGYRYVARDDAAKDDQQAGEGSELGVFKPGSAAHMRLAQEIESGLQVSSDFKGIIYFSKSSIRSRVHRFAYSDYIVVKSFDKQGMVQGDHCFLGLYTAEVYDNALNTIPIFKDKAKRILEASGLPPSSHDRRSLARVLETFPRDSVFLADENRLFETAMSVVRIQERRKVKLFAHRARFLNFVHCLVYVPRDLYTTELRQKIQAILVEAYAALESDFTTFFSESALARTQFVLRTNRDNMPDPDVVVLEQKIIEVTSAWQDQFKEAALDTFGEEEGEAVIGLYEKSFSLGYQENYSARNAVSDIRMIQGLTQPGNIAVSFYHSVTEDSGVIRFRVFHPHEPLELSDILPILENHGLRVMNEHPYEIARADKASIWLHDFKLRLQKPAGIDVNTIREQFTDSFAASWHGYSENDLFDKLVLAAKLHWREVALLRAYAHYMKQINLTFSESYIADALCRYSDIARQLVNLFHSSFVPDLPQEDRNIEAAQEKLLAALDDVDNLSDDRLFRKYIDLINATLRTNYYQEDEAGTPKSYLSLKLQPGAIPDIPQPVPEYEIFVYSPRVEGVHLRGGLVSRGGLRWSDRLEDFRTEVLGLVKAQQVKNAVIVPVGAKGGFVAKELAGKSGRDEIQKEGIACYELFIRGLLDITDNLVANEVVKPAQVICKDGDDPYLVVAADKGTASFSDIANGIATQYGFWLGDAFASGGSHGYDHKKMGITAKGAWVSVQRHFREMDVNVQQEAFTVIGIGDMSGDVFGNGMLLSEHIQLVAAFNHLHIFIDPTPDAARSFAERQRLFELPRSSWSDYDESLISAGGGVFLRSAKSVEISAQMKACFDIEEDHLTPNGLIRKLLTAPVDLVWNGGIGTYVKSREESHSDVGDKTNDIVRVNGGDLRCRVFGEGGNLGMTQLGRVEYSLQGGRCNTDFIDNAGGVDCSDHEVNMKIALDDLVTNGDMTQKQRNETLLSLTDAVSELVLQNNYRQVQAISVAQRQAGHRLGEYIRFISSLEAEGKLDRGLEFLPDDDVLMERKNEQQVLTRPELSVLISYAKSILKEELIQSPIAEEPYLARVVESAFPEVMSQSYSGAVYEHRLLREIVGTQLANDMINRMGIMFAYRMCESSGARHSDIARAYVCARDIYGIENHWTEIEALDYCVETGIQEDLMLELIRLVRRATRWFLRNKRSKFSIDEEVALYNPAVQTLAEQWGELLTGETLDNWQKKYQTYEEQGVPVGIARYCAATEFLYAILGIAEAAQKTGHDVLVVAQIYFTLGDMLRLPRFSNQLRNLTVESHWHALAREGYMDELEYQHRRLTTYVLFEVEDIQNNTADKIAAWFEGHAYVRDRWQNIFVDIQGSGSSDYPMYSVALRELANLVHSTEPDNWT